MTVEQRAAKANAFIVDIIIIVIVAEPRALSLAYLQGRRERDRGLCVPTLARAAQRVWWDGERTNGRWAGFYYDLCGCPPKGY